MSFLGKEFFIMDGATGTELQKRGMPAGACSEKWVLDHPDSIVEIQRGYALAGSDMVYAPTFGANRANLEKHGIEPGLVREYCLRLVELSRRAVSGTDVLVAGDIAPCGMTPEPYGEDTIEEIEDVFLEQAAALEEAGVDLFGVETQMNLTECRAAVKSVLSVTKKPVIVSFTCGPTGRTLWGDDLAEAMDELTDMGISAFGINCVGDLELLAGLLAELKKTARVPLIAKPNAGHPEYRDGKTVYAMTPETLAGAVPALKAAGAAIFGGCCGTSGEHIAALRRAVFA